MRWAIVALMVVGIVAALSAAILAAALRAQPKRADEAVVEPEATEVDVVVAACDLPAMSMVKSSAVALKTVSSAEAPDAALTDPIQVIGRVPVVPILEGEAFTAAKFANKEDRVHLAAVLPHGRRAMTVSVGGDAGIERLLYPGAAVDVVASFRLASTDGARSSDVVSAMLLQAVQVLAVGAESVVSGEEDDGGSTRARKTSGGARSRVTLLVNARQAEALQLAMQHGALAMVLRNPLDTDVASDDGLLLSELSSEIARQLGALVESDASLDPINLPLASAVSLGLAGETEQEAAEAPQWTMILHRGRETETRTFPLEE